MVLIELGGLVVSSTKVICGSIAKAFNQAVALNAPNGNIFQKLGGALFGLEPTTRMQVDEALQVLGFEIHEKPKVDQVKDHLNRMLTLNSLQHGGSPYLTERFIAAAHVIVKNK